MDSKYILGIDELDSQHEGIERLCIALQEAVDDRQHWCSLIDKLSERLKFHFYAEESIMKIFAYPESQDHQKSHLEIIEQIESYKDEKLTGSDIRILRDQPMQIFSDQILAQDMRFASFLKKNRERLGLP